MRFQNALGGIAVSSEAKRLINMNVASSMTFGLVTDVNNITQMVQVQTGRGSNWAMLMKPKCSRQKAGSYDMPNVGDLCLISFIEGDEKTWVIHGFVESENPQNMITCDDNKETGTLQEIKDKLKNRFYWKHETGTTVFLNKLGKFFLNFLRKASLETDPAKPNLWFDLDEAGNLDIKLFKDDGTPAVELTADAEGNVTITNAKDVTVNIEGDVNVNATNANVTADEVNLNNGSKGVARKDDAVEVTIPIGAIITPTGANTNQYIATGKINGASGSVKAGD